MKANLTKVGYAVAMLSVVPLIPVVLLMYLVRAVEAHTPTR